MNDRTRRTLTFFLFMVLGPFFTAALCGAIAVRRLPIAVHFEENALRRQIGFETKIESVAFQRWNAKKYTNCSFTPPGTEKPVLVFPELNIRVHSEDSPGSQSFWSLMFPFLAKSKQYYRITAPTLFVDLDSEQKYVEVDRLARSFVDRFREKNLLSDPDVLLEIEEIQVRIFDSHAKNDKKLRDRFQFTAFEGAYTPKKEQFPLHCKFSLRDLPSSDPIAFTVERITKMEPAQSNGNGQNGQNARNGRNEQGVQNGQTGQVKQNLIIQFNSGATPIPVRFVALLFPSLEVLGFDAYFHGTIRGQSSRVNQWALFFEDMQAENIPFSSLAKNLTPYPMSGKATFGIQSSKLASENGHIRFIGAKGLVLLENGSIHRGLLRNLIANQHTRLRYKGNVDPLTLFPAEQVNIPIVRCFFSFHLENGKAVIRPEVSEGESDLLLVLDEAKIFKYYLSPDMIGREIPYSLLFVPFSPPNTPRVPLTPQMQNLLKYMRM